MSTALLPAILQGAVKAKRFVLVRRVPTDYPGEVVYPIELYVVVFIVLLHPLLCLLLGLSLVSRESGESNSLFLEF